MSFDASTGVIEGTPNIGGSYIIDITATNEQGSQQASFDLNVIDDVLSPLILETETRLFAEQGTTFSYQVSATNFPIGFSGANLPTGFSIDANTGEFSGEAVTLGVYTFELTAINSNGSDSVQFTLEIIPPIADSYSQALDNNDLIFTIGEEGLVWSNQGVIFTEDADALESTNIGDNQSTSFTAQFTGSGVFSFWAKVSSEEGYDFLQVYLDGQIILRKSGLVDWEFHQFL